MKFRIKTSWYQCPVFIPGKPEELVSTMLSSDEGILDREAVHPSTVTNTTDERFFYVKTTFDGEDGAPNFEAIVEILKENAEIIEYASEQERLYVERE
jgi:hypothetical protein